MAILVFRVSLVCLAFLSVVIPNSLHIATACFLVLCATSSVFVMQKRRRLLYILALYGISLFITVIYVLVGVIKGASTVAVTQVLTTYALTPLLWIFVAVAMHGILDEVTFSKWTGYLIVLASFSVALYFYLFLNYGPDAVVFFTQVGNVNLSDGYVAATMAVYGSFIFFTGALFACPNLISNFPLRILCLLSTLIIAITSGRSALLLSVGIGALSYVALGKTHGMDGRLSNGFIGMTIAAIIGALIYSYISSVDLGLVFQLFFDELVSGGGRERVEQGRALMSGVAESWGLGAGHGIGVEYLRNEDYPWRYELVWIATLYRVGIVGFIVYIAPLFFYLMKFFKLYRTRQLSRVDIFMFGGLISSVIASNTNPYSEAFMFQWMYVVPFVFLMLKNTGHDGAIDK